MNAPRESINFDDVRRAATTIWWGFFNWVALLSWGKLAFTWILVMMASGILGVPGFGLIFLTVSLAIRVLAGGKLRAEQAAQEATARANMESLERRLVEAQMAALQAQIEPHFLFNTLALIGQLIETDPAEAAKVHANLVQYLRTAIPQMREQGGTTLGRQAALARSYLAIMQARMKERLTVSVEIPPSLEATPFPSMMLQTLVENSIKHGLEPKPEGGHVAIRAAIDGSMLRVEVRDDGMGFDAHADDGVGLANIRERLKVLYNGKARLLVEISPEGGTCIAILVPMQ